VAPHTFKHKIKRSKTLIQLVWAQGLVFDETNQQITFKIKINELKLYDMRTIEEIQKDMDNFEGKKSTKPYRELKQEMRAAKRAQEQPQAFGLGDVVESITEATGIKKVVEEVSDALGVDCGCDARKRALNEMLPLENLKKLFKRNRRINDISTEDYNYLCQLFDGGMPYTINPSQQAQIIKIYKNVFGIQKYETSCSPCLRSTLDDLYKVYRFNSK